VRLRQGDFGQVTHYDDSPLAIAQRYEAAGLTRLHVVDLDGAKTGEMRQISLLQQLSRETDLQMDYGGGIRSQEDVAALLSAGASAVNIGSLAVRQPSRMEEILSQYGGDQIYLSMDLRGGRIASHGWTRTEDLSVKQLLDRLLAVGLRWLVCTDIARDGMMSGPNTELYARLKQDYPELRIVASGGVHSEQDLVDLRGAGCDAVIIGKALLDGTLSLEKIGELC